MFGQRPCTLHLRAAAGPVNQEDGYRQRHLLLDENGSNLSIERYGNVMFGYVVVPSEFVGNFM